jgi:hypothetical protein
VEMLESKEPLQMVFVGLLVILTLAALVLIFSDMQGWL